MKFFNLKDGEDERFIKTNRIAILDFWSEWCAPCLEVEEKLEWMSTNEVGRLRYKTGNSFKTLNYNQSGFKIVGGRLLLSKVGSIPIKLHRKVHGRIKGIIVKREKSGKWFAIFQVEDEPELLPYTGRIVGIDVGIRHFLTDSDERQIENPRFYEKTIKR